MERKKNADSIATLQDINKNFMLEAMTKGCKHHHDKKLLEKSSSSDDEVSDEEEKVAGNVPIKRVK